MWNPFAIPAQKNDSVPHSVYFSSRVDKQHAKYKSFLTKARGFLTVVLMVQIYNGNHDLSVTDSRLVNQGHLHSYVHSFFHIIQYGPMVFEKYVVHKMPPSQFVLNPKECHQCE